MLKGAERKKVKKKIALLNRAIKYEYEFNDLERVYGGNPLSDEEIEKRIYFLREKIKELENLLIIPDKM